MEDFTISASEIARLVGGKCIGDGEYRVNKVGTLAEGDENSVGFLAEHKYFSKLKESKIGVVLLSAPEDITQVQVVVEDVRRAWRILCEWFQEKMDEGLPVGVSASAFVAEDAVLGEGVFVGAGAVIESKAVIGDGARIEAQAFVGRGVSVGEGSRLGQGAKLLPGTRVGARCLILANAVLGERGFGNHFEDGRWLALPQLGGVWVGDDVEIGAGTMVDRGAVGDTIIRDGVKLDNLIQVAHNVEIGEHTAIAGCCVIAGSVKFGRYCVVGGASVFAGHIEICDGAQFAGHSSVSKSITKPGMYSSAMPVMAVREWKRFLAKLRIFGREK